jgi:hypothetical protein
LAFVVSHDRAVPAFGVDPISPTWGRLGYRRGDGNQHERQPPDALRELAGHDITGPEVYFIDVLPLVEMIWADGMIQTVERDLLYKFLRTHTDNLNTLAGYRAFDYEVGERFVERFLTERPSPEVMAVLRKLIPPVRLSSSDGDRNARNRAAILAWCLDIGASCVTTYPYGDHDRFSAAEKACFEAIFLAL